MRVGRILESYAILDVPFCDVYNHANWPNFSSLGKNVLLCSPDWFEKSGFHYGSVVLGRNIDITAGKLNFPIPLH